MAFTANAILISSPASTDAPFRVPSQSRRGKGLSSSTVNILWGFFNAFVGYLLLAHVGEFHPRSWTHILPFGLGALLISLHAARHFDSSTEATRPQAHDQSSNWQVPLPEEPNFRLWSAGALVSNIGIWMQCRLQDWFQRRN